MTKVRKAVIPAAGLGTRFLPATKAIPKEMLPIVDTPTIQYIVEEAVASGIEEIVLVNGRGKSAIEDHFDISYELEDTLEKRGKSELFAEMRKISQMVRLVSVRQKEPLGLGHAVLCARDAVGDEPFAVLLGDDVFDCDVPATRQLIDVYQETGAGVLGAMEVPEGKEHLYGIISGEPAGAGRLKVTGLVEKPAPGTAPSRLAIPGRYLLPASVWPILAETKPGKGNEIQLTDALLTLSQKETLYAQTIAGERHDCGDRLGFLRANLVYAKKRPDLRDGVLAMCREILG